RTPLFERLAREGRLVEGAAHGDNTAARTNILPKGMSVAELTAGYKRLYAELLSDWAIAERIRNKLRHFGVPPRVRREGPGEPARSLLRLVTRGTARGGPPRAWHFVRSLPLTRPHLLRRAVNDWVAALALRDYAERHFGR